MKSIQVPSFAGLSIHSTIDDIQNALQNSEAHKIDTAPWPVSTEHPEVCFKIGYNADCIFLKYQVTEKEFRVTYKHSNDPVYKDSCVEFFISFADQKEYYNFEFNAIGTCLAAYGQSRSDRNFLPANAIENIKTFTSLQATSNKDNRTVTWEILLILPASAFVAHAFSTFNGVAGHCNFYKCGDDLEQPHFLCWNPVTAPEPDFHIPESFGAITFI